MAGDADKTEQATPQRRSRAREEGNFARARDAGPVASTFAVLGTLAMLGPHLWEALKAYAAACFREPYDLVHGDVRALGMRLGSLLALVTIPVALVSALAAGAIGVVQAGWAPNFALVMPKFERFANPVARLQHMFKPKQFASELVLNLGRVGVIVYATYGTVRDALPMLVRSSRVGLTEAAVETVSVLARVTLRATLALGVLAVTDFFFNRFRIGDELKMTKQEVKDEHKQTEGDPRAKAQIRAKGRERIKRAMLKQIRKSDVVLANPTHISVALRYRPTEGAPTVTAKGYDDIALFMREVARQAGIPVIENKPLARAIAARVKVGRAVPVELYTAVAEVLAFVYRLKGHVPWQQRAGRGPSPSPRTR